MVIFAFSSLITLQALVIAEYRWSNAQAIYFGLAAGVLLAVSLVSSSCLLPRLGAVNALRIGFSLLLAGIALISAAPVGAVMTVVGAVAMCAAAFALPAFAAVVTHSASAQRQAQTQALLATVALLPAAVGAILFSLMFDAVDHIGGILSVPFLTGTGIMVLALALAELWVVRGFPEKLAAAERAVARAAKAQSGGAASGSETGGGGSYDPNEAQQGGHWDAGQGASGSG